MTYWKTPEFKQLQQAWYQRLEAEGFEDAEEMVDGELVLRRSDLSKLSPEQRAEGPGLREVREEYFQVLTEHVRNAAFKSEVDRVILTARAEGKRAVEIVEILKERGTPRFRHSVRFIVRRYETLWGIRKYSPRQLGKKVG